MTTRRNSTLRSAWSPAARRSRKSMFPARSSWPRSGRSMPMRRTPRSEPGPTSAKCSWRATPSCTWIEDSRMPHALDLAINRRAFLGRYAGGLGALALAQLVAEADPLAPKAPRHPAKAKSVICLFQHGGPSQMDLFDPKPELTKQHGKPHPDKLEVHFHTQQGKLLASPFKFARRGKSGVELSELLPHTAGIVDDITLVRSMLTDSVDHEAALRVINSGKTFPG